MAAITITIVLKDDHTLTVQIGNKNLERSKYDNLIDFLRRMFEADRKIDKVKRDKEIFRDKI